MKMRVLTAGLTLMLVGSAWAQETPAKPEKPTKETQPAKEEKEKKVLKVGDKAPPLTIEKWVKGEPVTGFEKGKVYVVEFWATWCGPCIAGMPHLTEVQKEYKSKGVTVIGVTSKDSRGNTLESVEKMVKSKGDEKMGYTVAWDKDRTTNDAFMRAAEQNGIPCAFVVDNEGRVAWIGHPSFPKGELETVLDEVIAGKYDIKAAAKKAETAREDERKSQEIRAALEAEKFDEAAKLIDQRLAAKPANASELVFIKFQAYAFGAKDFDKAFAWAQEGTEKYLTSKADAMTINSMAWLMLDDPRITKRDPQAALKLAKKAVEFSDNKDGMILDTLALAQFETGDVKTAVETQRKAIELSKNDDRIDEATMDEMKGRLEKFEKAAKEGKPAKETKK